MIKSRPIIFSGEMVRAILDGRKSQTRRIIKVQPSRDDMQIITLLDSTSKNDRKNIGKHRWVKMDGSRVSASDDVYFYCPYRNLDHLWVRETFKNISSGAIKNGYGEIRYGFAYKADGSTTWQERPTIIHDLTGNNIDTGPLQFNQVRPWKSSIHMPRYASRITLEVTNVRVERLNDISEEDAIAEGIEMVGGNYSCSPWRNYELKAHDKIKLHCSSPIKSYHTLWESIHGKGSWDTNPWVWALEFRRADAPRP